MTITRAREPYARRPVPKTYDEPFFATEFSSIQRAIPAESTQTVRAAYKASVADSLILANATTGAFTVTLPQAFRVQGLVLTIKKADGSANAVTIGGTVDGVVNPTLATQYKAMTVQSDGVAWWKLASV